jgi:DNA polymerase-3 subunit alpha
MFIGLHNHSDHSNYRLRDSINTTQQLLEYTHKLGHKGIAITEHETIGSAVEIYSNLQKLKKENPDEWKDYKLILGNEIYLCNRKQIEEEKDYSFPHFILLAKDPIGHQQIRELSTRAWINNSFMWVMYRVPTYYDDLVDVIGKNKGHVIASSACLGGSLPQNILKSYRLDKKNPNFSDCIKWINWMKKLFGENNFYLELQPSKQEDQIIVNKVLVELSEKTNTPYIITTD